jgi:chromosome segregation ATPase
VRALQRKLNVSENDVKAHQDVINKLEVQLSRAEASVRENKKQLDTMNRERSSATSELTSLRGKILRAEEIKAEERATLQKQLDSERRYKEKAERARVILENRMEELMSKKNKFMCF